MKSVMISFADKPAFAQRAECALLRGLSRYGYPVRLFRQLPEAAREIASKLPTCPRASWYYGFKPLLIRCMLDQGYERIIWADTSVVFLDHPDALWALQAPVCMGRVIDSRHTANHLPESLLRRMNLPQVDATNTGQAGLLAFDFTRPEAVAVFEDWWKLLLEGRFEGDLDNWRSDQSCLSACMVAHRQPYQDHLLTHAEMPPDEIRKYSACVVREAPQQHVFDLQRG